MAIISSPELQAGFVLSCYVCGGGPAELPTELVAASLRDDRSRVVGHVYMCPLCFALVRGKDITELNVAALREYLEGVHQKGVADAIANQMGWERDADIDNGR